MKPNLGADDSNSGVNLKLQEEPECSSLGQNDYRALSCLVPKPSGSCRVSATFWLTIQPFRVLNSTTIVSLAKQV